MVNTVSAEPPSHIECAKFAVRGCPFLTIPTAKYREAKRPEEYTANPGMQTHNPEVSALWTCDEWHPVKALHPDGTPGVLVEFGDAKTVSYWREGREATPREVRAAFFAGVARLQAAADQDGGSAPAHLARLVDAAAFHLPEVA